MFKKITYARLHEEISSIVLKTPEKTNWGIPDNNNIREIKDLLNIKPPK